MKSHLSIFTINLCILSTCIFFVKPTHVYVSNCTPLRFEVVINYEYSAGQNEILTLNKPQTIMPYDNLSDSQNMLLEINRFLPEGEHYYTIKLIHGTDKIYLKQKCISLSGKIVSDLGISLSSSCIQDPWHMNNQAQVKHEHLISIDGHIIVIVYYAYGNNGNEDIEYSFYENLPVTMEVKKRAVQCSKNLAYHLAVPIISGSTHLNIKVTELLKDAPHILNFSPEVLTQTQILQEIDHNAAYSSYFLQQSTHREETFTSEQMLIPYLANPLIKSKQCSLRPEQEISLRQPWVMPRRSFTAMTASPVITSEV